METRVFSATEEESEPNVKRVNRVKIVKHRKSRNEQRYVRMLTTSDYNTYFDVNKERCNKTHRGKSNERRRRGECQNYVDVPTERCNNIQYNELTLEDFLSFCKHCKSKNEQSKKFNQNGAYRTPKSITRKSSKCARCILNQRNSNDNLSDQELSVVPPDGNNAFITSLDSTILLEEEFLSHLSEHFMSIYISRCSIQNLFSSSNKWNEGNCLPHMFSLPVLDKSGWTILLWKRNVVSSTRRHQETGKGQNYW